MDNSLKMKTALTIAGSDSSGGAGIQADIKTITCLGVYAMSAITALTAQNTTRVEAVMNSTPKFLAQQLDCVFTDIRPDAVKTGMMSNAELIKVTAEKLRQYGAENIVVDPVMVSTSGARLIDESAVNSLKELLFPLATLITPNIPEAEILCGFAIKGKPDMERAAKALGEKYGCAVLCKGGHGVNEASDVLFCKGNLTWLDGKKINNPNTHGTGCTLSSAIAAFLALGNDIQESVRLAKNYLTKALSAGLDLGKGSGPLAHNYMLLK